MRQSAIFVFLAFSFTGCEFSNSYSEFDSNCFHDINSQNLLEWQEGQLDIHHISTGRGDSSFMVFPDGTTLLFDAGDLDTSNPDRFAPLKMSAPKPNPAISAGQVITNYITCSGPNKSPLIIDYGVISHFHSDHYGELRSNTAFNQDGTYQLSGITEVGTKLPISRLLDRAPETSDYPIDESSREYGAFQNYLSFVAWQASRNGMQREAFLPGRNDQITLINSPSDYPDFDVRNVAGNTFVWTGINNDTVRLISEDSSPKALTGYSENSRSLALRIKYGMFSYFTGGDLTGAQGLGEPEWFDLESPVAAAIGEIDVLVLNHHGNRDATNANFLATLKPRTVVQQSWISDHPGGEVLHRLISRHLWEGDRKIFATDILEETKVAIGPWLTNNYSATNGHIMIRVMPGGDHYFVYVLDDSDTKLRVIDKHGPIRS